MHAALLAWMINVRPIQRTRVAKSGLQRVRLRHHVRSQQCDADPTLGGVVARNAQGAQRHVLVVANLALTAVWHGGHDMDERMHVQLSTLYASMAPLLHPSTRSVAISIRREALRHCPGPILQHFRARLPT
jgi:hypothetical protein